jgi:hypothetical protein
MKRIKPKAVLLGVLVDLGGSIVVGLVLAIAVAVMAGLGGDLSPGRMADLRSNSYLKLVGLIGTTFSTGLGGSRQSRPHGDSNAVTVGIVSLLLGITIAVLFPGVSPAWKVVAGAIVTLPAAYLGGRIANKRALS